MDIKISNQLSIPNVLRIVRIKYESLIFVKLAMYFFSSLHPKFKQIPNYYAIF